jgi:hypothetical protein
MKMNEIYINMLKFSDILDINKKYGMSDTLVNIAAKSNSKEKKNVGFDQIEALFAFMAWLTCRKEESGPFSAKHNAAKAAELVDEFCKSQGWEITPEKDKDMFKKLKPYPKEKKNVKKAQTND